MHVVLVTVVMVVIRGFSGVPVGPREKQMTLRPGVTQGGVGVVVPVMCLTLHGGGGHYKKVSRRPSSST